MIVAPDNALSEFVPLKTDPVTCTSNLINMFLVCGKRFILLATNEPALMSEKFDIIFVNDAGVNVINVPLSAPAFDTGIKALITLGKLKGLGLIYFCGEGAAKDTVDGDVNKRQPLGVDA